MPHTGRETEIKLAVGDAAAARRVLRAAGFRISRRRVFERNVIFDTADHALRNARRLVRIRQAGGHTTLTYKGPPEVGKHKSRDEIETAVGDSRAAGAVLDRIGFRPSFRYEKYRTEFQRPAEAGLATLDETPIGVFIELEGAPRWIDRAARALGFSPADYITRSYAGLYLERCAASGKQPRDMVF